jgi:hypothetical protein
MRGGLMVLLTLCGASGCLESRALQSGKYLCVTKTDCGYGWECVYGVDPEGRGLCVAPDHLPDAGPGDAVPAEGGPTEAGPTDGGPWPARGARWTRVNMIQPVSIATIANLELPPLYADGTFVTIVSSRNAGASPFELWGGVGVRSSDGGAAIYSFVPNLEVNGVAGPVPATRGTVNGAGGYPFAAAPPAGSTFEWSMPFVTDQPWLPLHKVSVSGTLDPDTAPALLPTSARPAMSGVLEGCFTQEDAAATYIMVLGQTLEEVVQSSGGDVDEDCTGSYILDGYHLKMTWQADEIVALVSP